jgi:AraC-like DNA-binding protein
MQKAGIASIRIAGRSLPLLVNGPEAIRSDPGARRFDIGELLFAQFSCPAGDETGIWSETDYLVQVLTGTATWKTSLGAWSAVAGEALFIKRGWCCFPQHAGDDLCLQVFFLSDGLVREAVRDLAAEMPAALESKDDGESVIRVNNDAALAAFFHAMALYFAADDDPPQALLRLKLEELVTGILLGQSNPRLSAYFQTLAACDAPSIAAVMERNFRHNLAIESFAQMCHRSLSSFKREFLRLYGTSPGKWLLERRLEHAASLLRNTRMNVTQVMLDSGFEDSSHFSKAFKDRFGRPPSAYRGPGAQSHLDV